MSENYRKGEMLQEVVEVVGLDMRIFNQMNPQHVHERAYRISICLLCYIFDNIVQLQLKLRLL